MYARFFPVCMKQSKQKKYKAENKKEIKQNRYKTEKIQNG